MDDAAIRFDKVGMCFRTPARGDVWALRHLSLSCPAGRITCVVGPSGGGKTTLLRLAAGLAFPTAGAVYVRGRPVSGPPEGVGMVSQEDTLLPWRRVLANISLGLEIRGVGPAERRVRSREVLRRVHLPPSVAGSYPHELSGGMRQRVALARALCPRPPILLMDEPFASLDEPTRHELQQELLDLWAADAQTVLFVTHSIDEALFLADHLVIMNGGRVTSEIRPQLPRPRDRLSPPFVDVLLRVRRALTPALDGPETRA
ncbi:MAG: ABC transporter ATP-binding protein [Planctomycetes bacterium]|nr:ABC transporter ATP-binding protein [Planctomycetota bacterium]